MGRGRTKGGKTGKHSDGEGKYNIQGVDKTVTPQQTATRDAKQQEATGRGPQDNVNGV